MDSGGQRDRCILRFGRERPPIPESLEDAWDEVYQENMRGMFDDAPPDLRPELEASIVAQEVADRYPGMTRFLVADDGYFWLRDPVPIATMLEEDDWFRGDQSYSPTWTILSPEGRRLAAWAARPYPARATGCPGAPATDET